MFKLKQFFCVPEGIDTASFFADQNIVDEGGLPDASSPEALAQQPSTRDASGAEDVDADTPSSDDPQQPTDKTVPLGALQEERTRRKQLEDRSRELETQNTALQERMNKFLELQLQQQQPKQPQPQEEQIPDFIDDPVGHINGLKAQFAKELQSMREQLQGNTQHQQQQVQFQHMSMQAQLQEAEFREVTPDYDAAVAHFQSVKTAEYAALGLNPVQCAQQLGRDSMGLVQHALATGKNPAEMLYNMAKALRYAPTAADPTAPPATPPKAPPTSLSTVPAAGRAPDEKGRLTAKDIANMPQDEFDKLFDSMRDNVQRPAF